MPTPILNNLIYYIKAEDLPITSEMSSNGYFIYSDGNEIRRVSASKLVGDILQATFEVITPSTDVPSEGVFRFRVLEPNTFNNVTPPISVSQNEIDNNWVYIIVQNGVARKELDPKPDESSKIKDWNSSEALAYPSVRVYDGIVYRVKEGQDVTGSDVPNNSSKWEVLIQDTNKLRLSVLQSVLDIGDLSQLNTDNSSSLVNAINELKEDYDFIQNTNANLLDSDEKIKEKYINYQRLDNLEESIFDTDGYFESDKIKPLSIETQMLSVGARSQRLNVEGVIWTPNYQDDVSKLKLSSGRLVHFTIDPDEPRIWNLSELVKTGLNNTSTYYIYAKCSRVGATATFDVTTQQIRFDDVAGFYYFLIGLAYPPIDGVRLIDKTYGASFIQGREITTGRIKSLDGGTYFDLDLGEIGGTIKFGGVKAEDYIEDEISKIEVGGRNYLLDTNFPVSSSGWSKYISSGADAVVTDTSEGVNIVNNTNGGSAGIYRAPLTEIGDVVTLSVYAKGFGRLRIGQSGSQTTYFEINSNEFDRYTITFEQKTNNAITLYVIPTDAPEDVTIRYAKLEKGTKATDWTPAPEDVEAEIQTARQNAIDASNAYADAQAEFERIQAEAYADGIVTSEEQRAIADAQAKLNEAKLYAEQQDAILEGVLENYTDDEIGKIEIGGANLIRWSNFNVPYSSDLGWSSIAGQHTVEDSIYKKTITSTVTSARAEWSNLGLNNYIDRNGTYTISLWYKTTKDLALRNLEGASIIRTVKPMNATGLSGEFQESVFVIEVTDFENLILRWYFSGNSQGEEVWIDKWQLEKGNKATDWTPPPEDVEAEIQQAKQDALDAQATANAVKEVTDWMNPTIIGGGGVVASGTMLVGNNAQGARAGISGLGTAGNSVRQWAGADFAGRATAPFVVLQDGTWKQHSANGVLVRRTGVIGGNYVDELYNSNGQVAKRTAIVNGKIVEQWYNDGVLVYEIGENGIYYVREIPESWTRTDLMNAGTGVNPDDAPTFQSRLCRVSVNLYKWRFESDLTAYLYQAGQNVNSESNRQYEGYKATDGSKTNNIADGWYIIDVGMVMTNLNDDPILSALNIVSGKVTDTREIIVNKSTITEC